MVSPELALSAAAWIDCPGFTTQVVPVATATPGGARANNNPTVPAVASNLPPHDRRILLALLLLRIMLLFRCRLIRDSARTDLDLECDRR
ncbi:MAG TPA: hypothetical protein VIJ00_18870 [Nakamurella sp.]|jgi:hypothetical protein